MAKLYYVGKDMNANDLTHWKYIRREKVNGKWRYYYKDANTGRDTYVKKPDLKTKVTAAVQDKLGYDEREAAKNASVAYKNAKAEHETATKKQITVRKNDDYRDSMQRIHAEQKSVERTADQYNKSLTKYEQTKKAYAKTPLSKIENLAAKTAKGREAVKKAANKTVSQVKKAVEKGKAFVNTVKALNQARKITKNVKPTTTTVKTKWGTFTKTRRN